MASNMYIKIDGIGGGSSAEGYNKEIEILAWNHGFSQPTSPVHSTAGEGTVEQANHQVLSFSKYTDSATPDLLRACWSGALIKEASIYCYRADGNDADKPVEYLRIVMEQVVIANLSIAGGPGDAPVENVALDYGVVRYVYNPQDSAQGEAGRDSNQAVQHNLMLRKVS